ncbi:MAG: TIGR03936 family radical SAM-associated protein, partial [Microcystaceae cyanobacterium]
ETDVDVIGIAETVRWLRRECRLNGRKRLDFNITISNFTPKPHTPFQWHSVSTTEFIRKQELLRDEFRGMKGVKVNYTDVRISAMEDFVGRGDRRLATVIRRAWELGAGMDAWWENLDKAFAAWEKAIAQSDLTWKYRQVENGEFENSKFKIQNSKFSPYDAPLPWDHLNTGIDKNWLKADLQRALEAATVPDCAFDGCSHCGVCGLDFGHNIVFAPPPIPEFAGHFQPNQARVQRFRVWFGKQGEMSYVSHLDLVRLFDRAVRRAALPISFTGGFHPGPRISIANALPLGATSSGEIVDFELTRRMEIGEFREKLEAQFPVEIPIYRVEEIDLKAPAATRLLEKAEYLITVAATQLVSLEQWQSWIDAVIATPELLWEKKTKSGKETIINLRDRLFALTLESQSDKQENAVILGYIGSCR